MKLGDVFKGWGRILMGYQPFLSIEITRSCPLHCPGCYAYNLTHLSGIGSLKDMEDYRDRRLIDGVLSLVEKYRPLHLSIVGGEPLLRARELDILLPKLSAKGIGIQIVTSGVTAIPDSWKGITGLQIVVSVDGLPKEHNARRSPATYDRILKNIAGTPIIVHCVISSQMTGHPGYFEEFLEFWTGQPEVEGIWFSFFTPQKSEYNTENLGIAEKKDVLRELTMLRPRFPKLYLPDPVVNGYLSPPSSPEECIFARTTLNYSSDLITTISPCQFGGDPDCSQCGCMATAGLAAVGDHRLFGIVPLHAIFSVSGKIGENVKKKREKE